MTLEDQQNSNWSVECSDEEGYFESNVNYRRLPAGGGRIWEPSGEEIAQLYGEMETVGLNRLQWQCPGRISPSQLAQETTDGQFENPEDSNSLAGGSQTKSKFDFDNEFDDEESPSFNAGASSGNRVTAKRTQAVKKQAQTNLSKVMLNIKKYQMIDQKGGDKSGAAPGATSTAPVSGAGSTFQSSTASGAPNNGTTTTNNSTAESNEYDEFQ